jgi:hypothetical protein
MTIDQYMQLQDMQKRQALGQALLNGNAGQQNAAYGGLANAGSSILGAALADKARTDQDNMFNKIRYQNQPDNQVSLGQMQGVGGAPIDLGSVSSKTPLIQAKPGWFANLFSFGGGS